MSNNVKFRRGTSKSFAELEKKDPNTLYFIVNNEEKKSLLYLGDLLIVSGDDAEMIYLSSLQDIDISNLKDGETLVFDTKSGKWINQTLKNYVTEEKLKSYLNDNTLCWGELKNKGE